MFRLSSYSHLQAETDRIFWYTIYKVFKHEISFTKIIFSVLGYEIQNLKFNYKITYKAIR